MSLPSDFHGIAMGKNKTKNKSLSNANHHRQNPQQPVSNSSNQNGVSLKSKSKFEQKMSKPTGSFQQKGLKHNFKNTNTPNSISALAFN